jgi:hypothetical protein
VSGNYTLKRYGVDVKSAAFVTSGSDGDVHYLDGNTKRERTFQIHLDVLPFCKGAAANDRKLSIEIYITAKVEEVS